MRKQTLTKHLILTFLLCIIHLLPAAHAVQFERAYLYDRYTLEDAYLYKKGVRGFQWGKIDHLLAKVETFLPSTQWGILQNNKNENGRPPLVKNHHLDSYHRVADAYGIQQYQGIPLYSPDDLSTPERYSLDGALVKMLDNSDTDFIPVETVTFPGKWMVPSRYLYLIAPGTVFNKVIVVDRTNQNIATLERQGEHWMVRSMNPATTGLHRPPYQMETPLGIFVLQEKKRQMQYFKDGTTEIGGFAPYANRFSGGGYIHGIPVDRPNKREIEVSSTLGTTPRSHKCVRNATSHAFFIYNWAPVDQTIIAVID